MKLRCKEGDLAAVIYDTPPCAANIGRIVEVRGPVKHNFHLGLSCWLVKPVSSSPYIEESFHFNRVQAKVVDWQDKLEHPDAWLVPLPKLEDEGDEAMEPTDAKSARKMKVAKKEPGPVPVTSLAYRPSGYFGIADVETELLSKVKGVARRSALREILEQGQLTDIPEALTRASLTGSERSASGRIHPVFMGGEYLETAKRGEIEIARISIKSTTYDVTSVYARRSGKRIHYRVVDEYGSETFNGRSTRTSLRPLTMGQLIAFFLGAWNLCNCLECNFEDDVVAMLEFFDGESEFYPCFDSALRKLVKERFPLREDSE